MDFRKYALSIMPKVSVNWGREKKPLNDIQIYYPSNGLKRLDGSQIELVGSRLLVLKNVLETISLKYPPVNVKEENIIQLLDRVTSSSKQETRSLEDLSFDVSRTYKDNSNTPALHSNDNLLYLTTSVGVVISDIEKRWKVEDGEETKWYASINIYAEGTIPLVNTVYKLLTGKPIRSSRKE